MPEPSQGERRLIAFTHLEDYLQTFLERWVTPSLPLKQVSLALEEVAVERMRMYAERREGAPRLRRGRPKKAR